MAYTVMFSEAQRVLLLKVLKSAPRDLLDQTDGSGGMDGESELSEFEMFMGMLDDLPKIEAADPGCVHGFCL